MLFPVLAAMALMASAGPGAARAQSVHVVRLATATPRVCVAIPVGHRLEIVLDRRLVERLAARLMLLPTDAPVDMVPLRARRARALLHDTSGRKGVLGCHINDAVMRSRRDQHVAPDWAYLVWKLFRQGDVGVWNGATRSFLARAEELNMDEHCRTGLQGFFILQTLSGVMLLSARTCQAELLRPPAPSESPNGGPAAPASSSHST